MDILCGAMSVNFFSNSTVFQGWVLLQGAQLCRQLHKVEGCGSGWAEAKKYKSKEGNW